MNIRHQIHEAIVADLSNVAEHTRRTFRSDLSAPADAKSWNHEIRYTFADGSAVTLNATSSDATVFPASAGFEILSFNPKPGTTPERQAIRTGFQREPVIAWIIHFDHGVIVEAVGPEESGTYGTATFRAIRFPSGQIQWKGPYTQADVEPFLASEEAWIDHVLKVWAAQHAEEQERLNSRCRLCGARHADLHEHDLPF
ncbi:MAG TPA: hypothetical protein VGN97_10960 [Mesorhizobium sp.]|jgi:hypothetical protein|nr:hypothetical protein [Mesorhizobium sp.]